MIDHKSFNCDVEGCVEVFTTSNELVNHKKRLHKPKPTTRDYGTNIDGPKLKEFRFLVIVKLLIKFVEIDKVPLKLTKTVHSESLKIFVAKYPIFLLNFLACDICGRMFFSSSNLRNHKVPLQDI